MKGFFILFMCSVFVSSEIYSQNILNVRSLSMGNTSASSSYELDAFNQNPANILNQRLNKKSAVYFNILTNAGVLTSSNFLSLNFYNNYFGEVNNGQGRALTEDDKQTILRDASDQPSRIFVSARLLSFVLNTKKSGSYGISIDERFSEKIKVSRDFLNVGLFGNLINSTYNLSGSENNTYWVRQINLTYANSLSFKNNKTFDELAFGVSVKPQLGLYYLNTRSNDLMVTTNNFNQIQGSGSAEFLYSGLTNDNNFKYSLDNAGFGVGFDAGINARIKNVSRNGYLNLGLSITDIGFIKWDKNTANYFYDGNFLITDITNRAQLDSLKDKIKATKTSVTSFTTTLPTTVRFGASYKFTSSASKSSLKKEIATIAVDYVQGFNEDLGGSKKPSGGIGGEYNITDVILSRIGFGFGGLQDFAVSLGLGINAGPVIFDIGTYNVESIFKPKGTTKFSAGLNIKFKIN
ncbi:MAG: DUF5723 family protein [bacterium]